MLKSSLLVSFLSLLGSIISFVSQVVIAKLYGTSTLMDNFIIISSMPQMLSGIMVSSLSYSLVPILLESKLNQVAKSNQNLLSLIVIFGAIICCLGLVLEGFILHFLHHIDIFQTKTFVLGIVVWIAAYLGIIVSYFNCHQNATNSFFKPVFASMFPALLTILLCELLNLKLGILTLGLGLLLGNSCALLFVVSNDILHLTVDLKKVLSDKTVRDFYSNLPFIVLSMLSFSIFQFIDSLWAVKVEAAALSYLAYCQRLIVSIGTLVIIGPSTVLIPHISAQFLNGKIDELRNDVINVLKVIFLLGSYVTIIWLFFGHAIIRILFQRGAFDSASTDGVASIIPFMSLGMIFMLFVVVLMRVLYVMKEYKKGAMIGFASLLIYFVLSGVFSSFWGVKGISYAYIITWLLLTIFSMKFLFQSPQIKVIARFYDSSTIILAILIVLFLSNVIEYKVFFSQVLFGIISLIYFFIIFTDNLFSIYLQRIRKRITT